MQIRVPEYYEKFKCIADRCKDSCCIGWEIDVDAVAEEKYRALDTELGREIVEKTKQGFFPLEENGRCAFLDCRGLCRIISTVGEGYLCDICREHPRYYGISADGLEGGLGLGCEEAARMILSLTELPKTVLIDRAVSYSDSDEYAGLSDRFRKRLYSTIFTECASNLIGIYYGYASEGDYLALRQIGNDTCVHIPSLCYIDVDADKAREIYLSFIDLLYECEALDDGWYQLMNELRCVDISDILKKEDVLRPLLYYFTHRYVRDGVLDLSLGVKVLFALCSSMATVALSYITVTDDPQVRAAVMFSKNIEYSTDNVDMILDRLSDLL